ncbi:MAG: DNA cytosine methyltransferase [Hyphomicrobiales bacterium]
MGQGPNGRSVLSLFSGAGGLDVGLETAGFEPVLCVEIDEDSRETLRLNRPGWRLADPGDIHALEPTQLLRQAAIKPRALTLLAGGTPCQPFSKSSYWFNGDAPRLRDPRAGTLHAYLDVVEATLPQILLLENVKGLAFDGKDEGLRFLERGLRRINKEHRTSYAPQVITLNAADYGVPQIRERVFVLASIDGRHIEMPESSHGDGRNRQRFLTAWDAIGDLDGDSWPKELDLSGRWAGLLPSIPEGQNYLWHTPRNGPKGGEPLFGWRTRFWSFLLKLAKRQPSWTIQAYPGPATGPFHWKSRLLSIEEMCRLQTFPREYTIVGSRRSAHRQVGNAVPSAIGEFLGLEVRRQLLGERVRKELRLLPEHRSDCPPPERVAAVPREYLKLRARHRDHPGTGHGPAARLRERAEA